MRRPGQSQPLAASDRIRRIELVHLEAPTPRGAAWFEWMVDLELNSASDAAAVASGPPLSDLLSELRSLRLRPVVLLAERVYRVGGQG